MTEDILQSLAIILIGISSVINSITLINISIRTHQKRSHSKFREDHD